MRPCLILCAALLTATCASLPLSLSSSPSSSWPQLTVSKAEAFVTYRRARVATRRAVRRDYRQVRRAYRYGAYHGARPYHRIPYVAATRPAFYGYPYTAPNYAYRHVYAAPAGIGWNRWGRGGGWGWGHRWGHGFGWGWHRGWRW